MHSQTNEQALEAAIEKHLSGTCLEDIKEQGKPIDAVNEDAEVYRNGKGFLVGQPANFNAQYAIDDSFGSSYKKPSRKS